MKFPQIQIATTKGFLHIQTSKAVQEIQQPGATLRQSQPAAILDMSTTNSKLSIDSTEARAEIDLKSVRRRIQEHAQNGKQAALQGMARRAAEGRQLMQIEHGGNAFAQIAKQNQPRAYQSLGIRFVGNKSGVKTNFQPGTLDIRVTPQQASNQVQINKPVHKFTPSQVSTSVNPMPSIRIDVKW